MARKKNPAVGSILFVTALVLGGGYLVYDQVLPRIKKRKEEKKVSKIPEDPDVPEDNWGIPMTPSTQALIEGVPVRLFKDGDDWNYAYSWSHEEGSGELWDWLSAEEEFGTVLVLSEADSATKAYTAAASMLSSLSSFVKNVASKTDMPFGLATTQVGGYKTKGMSRWGVVRLQALQDDALPIDVRVVSEESEWGYVVQHAPQEFVTGCCFDLFEATEEMNSVLG